MNDDLDRRFAAAATSLDTALTDVEFPGSNPRRSSWPVMAAASLVVVLVGVGAFLATRSGDGGGDILQPADVNSTPVTTAAPIPTVLDTTPVETTGDVPPPVEANTPRAVTESAAGEITAPVASITQSFNADGSLALLYRTGIDGGTHVVFETNGWSEVATLDLSAATDIEDIVWDRSDPDVLRYLDPDERALIDVNVSSAAASTRHTFDGCTSVGIGDTSGSWAAGSDLLAVVCNTADAELWVAFDLDLGQEVARVDASASDAPLSMASGAGFVSITGDRLVVFDDELDPTGVSFDVEVSAFATAVVNGANVLAATVFDGDEDTVGTVVTFGLDTGERNVVIGPATGWQYPPSGTTMSIASGSLIAISTSPGIDAAARERLDDIVAVVDLATGELIDATAHDMSNGDRFANWSTPFVALSPDGSQLLYSSDQSTDRVNTVLVPR